jgi:sugar phosphate isomerase/epimerase
VKPETYAKLVVENKPSLALDDRICRGATVEEMRTILDSTGLKFCFDIGHAIKSALYQKVDISIFMSQLIELSPLVVHVSDGRLDNYYDEHKHLGEGEFDLATILSMLDRSTTQYFTIESNKLSKENLDDFEQDVHYAKERLLK